MHYYSTNHMSSPVNFREAAITGMAPDKGLYFPEKIPLLPGDFIHDIKNISNEDIAFRVIEPFVADVIKEDVLEKIVAETINFDFPLVRLNKNIFSLELFHGPTLAFKDVGARFMSRCLEYFVRGENKNITVLVATSGDTGGAVASGFYGVDGVNAVILYPSGKVSNVQELQLTTHGKNIKALEVDGTFDDCQDMVKQAFADTDLSKKLFLTSANSINVARWLPQQFYYFFAYKQWKENELPVISVPSGNLGNLGAGLLAYKRGLPVKHFIGACNANDVLHEYLTTGNYSPRRSVQTLSNAMDVGAPGNLVRVLELFNREFSSVTEILSSYSVTDEETQKAIDEAYKKTSYQLDPHGAVGYSALKKYLLENPGASGFFLETAHPIKFYDIVGKVIQQKLAVPEEVISLLKKEKKSVKISAGYSDLKDYLLSDK